MKNWPTAALGQVSEVAAGQGAPQNESDFGTDGHPFVRAGSLQELVAGGSESVLLKISPAKAKEHRLRLFAPGTILFAKSGMSSMLGRVHPLSQQAYVVNHLAALTPGDKLDGGYLVHWLRANPPSRLIKDASYPSIRLSDVSAMQIPLPPLPEQRRIAAILDKADGIRRKRVQATKIVDALLRSVFLEMFGNPMNNPKAWPVVPFGDACHVQLGKMLSAKARKGERPVQYLRNANVQWRRFDLDDLLAMDFSDVELEKFDLRDGDLLICEGGEVGRCAIWRGAVQACSFQKSLHRVRILDSQATPEYLQEYLFNLAAGGGLVKSTTSATISHLTKEKLERIPLVLPPLDMQRRFSLHVQGIEKYRKMLASSSSDLEGLSATLAASAFKIPA